MPRSLPLLLLLAGCPLGSPDSTDPEQVCPSSERGLRNLDDDVLIDVEVTWVDGDCLRSGVEQRPAKYWCSIAGHGLGCDDAIQYLADEDGRCLVLNRWCPGTTPGYGRDDEGENPFPLDPSVTASDPGQGPCPSDVLELPACAE